MKKFVISMVIIILIGAVLTGIGCAVFFTRDFRAVNVEYIEKFFETESEIASISLNLENAHKVRFERGEKCSVKYFDSDVSNISISEKNGKMTIEESCWSWKDWFKRLIYNFKTTEVVITVTEDVSLDLNGTLNGATEVNLPSWQYGNINLDVRGASSIVANDINAESVSLNISGATSCTLSGKANWLKAYASGSVVLRCDGLDCALIDIHSSGSANVNLSGTGSELNFEASGSGKLLAKDFTLDRADIDVSGSINAELCVSTLLKVNASGSAYISYWGDPQVDKHITGSSKIVKKG